MWLRQASLWRSLINSQIADALLEQQIRVARVETAARLEALRLLRLLEQDLVSALKEVDPSEPRLLSARQLRLQRLLLDEVRPLIEGRYQRIAEQTADDGVRLAVFLGQDVVSTINGLLGLPLLTEGLSAIEARRVVEQTLIPTVSTAQELSAPAATWWDRQKVHLEQRLFDQINVGLVQGESLSELTRRVRGTMERGFTDGVMELSRRDAARLIRTHISAVGQQARMAVYDAHPESIRAIRQLSTLDGRTSLQCVARHGNRYSVPAHRRLGGTVHPYAAIPLHWQCRSIYVPEVVGGGTPAPQETFDQFLRRRGEAFQDEMLGPTRARLFREQKLTTKDLVDAATGTPLTLEELGA